MFANIGKAYDTVEEEAHALDNFIANEKIILEHNSGNSTFVLGHNEFSDLSWPEFKNTCTSGLVKSTRAKNFEALMATTADTVGWVAKSAVTPVKNQGQCGSCWAFSTTGSAGGAFQIADNPLTSSSEQDLMSCAGFSRNQGCNGGLMDNAFTWIESNCIVAEAAYQYTPGSGTTGTCKKTAAAAKVSGYSDVPQGSESGVKSSIAQEPTSVATKADKSVFQLCKPGVGDFDSTQIFDSAHDHDLHPNICLQTYLLPKTIFFCTLTYVCKHINDTNFPTRTFALCTFALEL